MFADRHSFNFTSGTPTYVAGTALSNPSIEGVSSISDGYGNILFYSDGNSVYDANNNLMPNGNGTQNAFISATSSTLITKIPGDCDKYYLFYLADKSPGQNKLALYYSVIDMTLNGGLGDIITTQTNLLVYSTIDLSEKMISVQKGLTDDYWVIVRSSLSDDFYAFEVTSAGVNINPVISNVSATIYSYNPAPALVPTLGWMAVSPQNDAIVEANGLVDSWLYDFNNTTGVLSNQEVLINNAFPASTFELAYGCEFSPDGQIIYIGVFDGSTVSGFIYQFDRSGGPGTAMGTLQTYPMLSGYITMRGRNDDGKIYFVMEGESGLSVIDDPDNFAAPNILINNYLFSSGVADLSLANDFRLWNEQVLPINFAGIDDTICLNDSAVIGCNSCDSIHGIYQWEPSALVMNPNNKVTLTQPLAADQEFVLHTINNCADTIKSDTIIVTVSLPLNATLNTNSPICENQALLLNASPAGLPAGSYNWVGPFGPFGPGGLSSVAIIPSPTIPGGWYYVTVDSSTCSETDSAFVVSNPTYNIIDTITICSGDDFIYADGTISTNIFVDESHISSLTTLVGCDSTVIEYLILGTNSIPTIYTPDSWYCMTDNVTDLTSDVGDLWFSDASLSIQVAADTFFTPPALLGTVIYYVVDTSGGCISLADSVSVTFDTCSYPCPNNLLLNGGFESYSSCPNTVSQLTYATNWLNIQGNSNDYYNQCGYVGDWRDSNLPGFNGNDQNMFINPQGNGYAGFFSNVTPPLSIEGIGYMINLKKCVEYTLQFRMAHNGITDSIERNICIYGGDSATSSSCMSTGGYDNLACIQADSINVNWRLFSLTFTPTENYSYLAFAGECPSNSILTNEYVYIDDVFLCSDTCANKATNITSVLLSDDSCFANTGSATINFTTNCYTGFDITWSSGSNVVSTDSILSNISYGTYDVSVIDSNNCEISTTINIPSFAVSSPNLSNDTAYCENELISDITALGNGGIINWYSNNSLNNLLGSGTSYSPTNTFGLITYYANEIIGPCISDYDSINITINLNPIIDAYGDTTVFSLNDAYLSVTGGSTYVWSPSSDLSCSTCQYPTANVTETTVFYVTVTDTNGCIATDSVEVKIEEVNNLYIPNVFSPNGDGYNDVLLVRGATLQNINFRIFNRWGEKVFETTDITKGWDGKQNGKPVDSGVYVYQLIYTDWQNVEEKKSGNVTLIR